MIPTVTYGLIYTVPFKSIKDNSFLIEIYKRDYTGTSTELIGSVSPFVITIEDADLLGHPQSPGARVTVRFVGMS